MTNREHLALRIWAKLALEALKGDAIVSEMARRFGLNLTMIDGWECALLHGASNVFERDGRKALVVDEDQVRDFSCQAR